MINFKFTLLHSSPFSTISLTILDDFQTEHVINTPLKIAAELWDFDKQQHAIESQTGYVEQQLLTELRVRQANMLSAIAQYQAAQSQLITSQTYYKDVALMYKEGMAIYIELLDAQNQWVDSQLQANIALFDTWISYSAIERAAASFNIQK